MRKDKNSFNRRFVKKQDSEGCNCRRSSCIKNYCECFNSGQKCGLSCNCDSCKNPAPDYYDKPRRHFLATPGSTAAKEEPSEGPALDDKAALFERMDRTEFKSRAPEKMGEPRLSGFQLKRTNLLPYLEDLKDVIDAEPALRKKIQ